MTDRPGSDGVGPARQRFFAALLDGDATSAASEVDELLASGLRRTAVYSQVMAPALHEVGELWARGELSISEEHMASSVAEVVLERIAHPRGPADAAAPAAVVAGAPGEGHAVGARMVADCLVGAGWRVFYVGASAPAHDVARFALRRRARLLAFSVSLANHLPAIRQVARALGPRPRPYVLAGGRATRASRLHPPDLGIDAVCNDLDDLVELASRLVAEGW